MEQYIPILLLAGFCLYQIIKEKALSSKYSTMDKTNLHRAGIRLVKRYSDPNDSGIHPDDWDRLPNESEGEEFVSQLPSMN